MDDLSSWQKKVLPIIFSAMENAENNNRTEKTKEKSDVALTLAAENIQNNEPVRDSRGRFVKGFSNPVGGRRALSPEMRKALDLANPEAVHFLQGIMQNENIDPNLRIKAATALLNSKSTGKNGKYSKKEIKNK